MSDPDVLSLEQKRDELRDEWPITKDRGFGGCRHQRLTVVEDTGSVECRDCGEAIDPIRALLHVAHWFQRYHHSLQEIRDWRASNRRRVVDGELGDPLDGRRHLVETASTGRLHTVHTVEETGPRPECGTNARVRAVDRNLAVPSAKAVLRHAYGCSRCLKKL